LLDQGFFQYLPFFIFSLICWSRQTLSLKQKNSADIFVITNIINPLERIYQENPIDLCSKKIHQVEWQVEEKHLLLLVSGLRENNQSDKM